MEEHLSCRRRSDVLRCCSIQDRVVHTPNKSTQPSVVSVVDEQESELVQSSFRSNEVQSASFLTERARCTQVHPSGIRRVFDFGFDHVPGYGDANVFANTRSLRQF